MIDLILNYLQNSTAITITVLAVLSLYLISIFWVFIFKNFSLNETINIEKESLDSLLYGSNTPSNNSVLKRCLNSTNPTKEILSACESSTIKDATNGLSWLSIVASTSPFIGLFGTVIGILESFAAFASKSKVSFSVIAPVISEALVATAGGIFVAIFAYTFHQILNRKCYELSVYLKTQSDLIISKKSTSY
jgi:biopolymer transport protein ExbB/TolQ